MIQLQHLALVMGLPVHCEGEDAGLAQARAPHSLAAPGSLQRAPGGVTVTPPGHGDMSGGDMR